MTVTAPAPAREAATAPAQGSPARFLRRPAVMCVVLFLAYFGLSLLNDPRAFLGTDTGGKVATLRVMDERNDLDPDLGYWAESLDSDGVVHPIALNSHIGDKWVNVTTLPMIIAARPLYELGGLRGILVLPMLGGVLTALGARSLARRLGDDSDRAFWLIGLVTPVVVYSLDFWEHTLGLACMVWGVVLLYDVVVGARGWRGALAGGLLFGAAATMRTEALVYACAAFAVLGITALVRRRRFPLVDGIAAVAGVGSVLLANQWLERIVLGDGLRATRASNAADRVGAELSNRANDALVTTVGLNRFAPAEDWLLGGCIVAFVAVAAVIFLRGRADQRRAGFIALGTAALGYLLWLDQGLGFLPGVLTASPLAVVGLVGAWQSARTRVVALVALAAFPLVWAFQYSGGANPQWGGRYVLCSSTLLAVVGVVALRNADRRAVVAISVLTGAVTVTGLAWLSVRSHALADAFEVLDREPTPLVVTQAPHLLREGGAFYDPEQQWLNAESGNLDRALDVVDRSGAGEFTLVTRDEEPLAPRLEGFRRTTTDRLEVLPGVEVLVTRYVRA